MIRVGAVGVLALAGLVACASRRAPAAHTGGPASRSTPEAAPAQVTRALDGEPPVPGSDTSGWQGLQPTGDPHAAHAGHDHAAHAKPPEGAGSDAHAGHADPAGAAPALPAAAGTAAHDAHKDHASHADHAQHRGHALPPEPAESAPAAPPSDALRPDGGADHEHVHGAH